MVTSQASVYRLYLSNEFTCLGGSDVQHKLK